MKKTESGRSIIEILGVLGIMMVLMAGTLRIYDYADQKSKLFKFEQQINDIAEDVKTLFIGRNWDGFARLSTANSSQAYLMDKEINLRDPFGNDIMVLRTKSSKIGKFYIKVSKVNLKACLVLAKRVPSTLKSVNGKTLKSGMPKCTKGKKNTLSFYYR